eukprot:gene7433-8850_t
MVCPEEACRAPREPPRGPRSAWWAVGDDATIMRSTDGGVSWEPARSPCYVCADWHYHGVAFWNGTHGWVVGTMALILHTVDGGNSWNIQLNGLSNDVTLTAIQALLFWEDIRYGWLVGESSGNGCVPTLCYQREPGSMALTAYDIPGGSQETSSTHRLNAVHFISRMEVYPARDHAAPRPDEPILVHASAVRNEDVRQGWAAGQGGTLVATADGGGMWRNLVPCDDLGIFHGILFDSFGGRGDAFLVGESPEGWGVACRSEDNGATWLPHEVAAAGRRGDLESALWRGHLT